MADNKPQQPKKDVITLLRGTVKERAAKRVIDIRKKYATKFRKLPLEVGMRTAEHETIKEPKTKLYGCPRIVQDGARTLIVYKIRTGWKKRYSPSDYNEKSELKPMAQPISKDPIVERVIEEVK